MVDLLHRNICVLSARVTCYVYYIVLSYLSMFRVLNIVCLTLFTVPLPLVSITMCITMLWMNFLLQKV